jgi:Concanavalin A-like lectin/glucanases superfamily
MRTSRLALTVLICILGLSALWLPQSLARGLGPDPSLLLHLDFDEDFITAGKVLDVTGNGHDAWQFDATNNIAATNGVFGTTAGQWTYKFYQTDGFHIYPASQYLAVTNLSGIRFLTNATISFWAQIDPNGDLAMNILSAGYDPYNASGGVAAATNGWFIARDSSANLWFVTHPSGVSSHRVVWWPNDTLSGDLSTTSMHLYTVTIDCIRNIVISWYDGQPQSVNTIDIPWIRIYGTANLPWLAIGTATMDGTPQWGDDLYPNTAYFVGRMDDIRIYNRTLSTAEVQALYQGSTYAQNLAIHKAAPQSVQVRWAANSNAVYQVEYRSNLAQTAWSPLQSAIPGSVTNSIIDSILGQPSRFYRVRVLP